MHRKLKFIVEKEKEFKLQLEQFKTQFQKDNMVQQTEDWHKDKQEWIDHGLAVLKELRDDR